MGSYDTFKKMFERFSREAGKKQYLIPYFIAAHPGCEDDDMVKLAQWLKGNEFKVDQVQTFYPSPMSLATAMYHSERNPLKKVSYKSEKLYTPKNADQRKIQKALLRYHDESNWPLLQKVLPSMGYANLIGDRPECLVPNDSSSQDSDHKKRSAKQGDKRQGRNTSGAGKQSKPTSRSSIKNGKPTKATKGKKARQKSLKPR